MTCMGMKLQHNRTISARLGKGEVESSILSNSTIFSMGYARPHPPQSARKRRTNPEHGGSVGTPLTQVFAGCSR